MIPSRHNLAQKVSQTAEFVLEMDWTIDAVFSSTAFPSRIMLV